MDNNGPDQKNHNDGARKSFDNEDEGEKIAQQTPPPLMIDEDSRVVAVIRNRVSPAREGQPLPVLVRTIEPLPDGGVPVRIANDIINGKYDDVQLSPPAPTEEAAAANPVIDPDQGAAASAAAAVQQEPDELVNLLTEDVTKNLSFESISSTSESENDGDEALPAQPLPRGSSPPPPPPSGAAGASNRLYDFPYPIVRSGRFTNLADVPRVMQEDTERALGEWECRDESSADECYRSVPAWQTRQRRPGNIAMTPPPISVDYDDDDEYRAYQRLATATPLLNVLDIRTTPRETTVTKTPFIPPRNPLLLMRPFADRTRIGTPPIDLRTRRAPLQTPMEDRDKKLAGTPPVDLKKTSRTPPPPPQQQQQQPRRLFGMDPPRSPGVLRTRIVSPLAPQRRHSQPSTAAPPLYAGLPPRRTSVPVRHLSGMANGTCDSNGSNGTGLAEGGWAARHACENEDCRSFWQHLQECGLQLPPGWYVMQHEDARGRPYAYVVQLDVGARDMVPNLARSIMIDQLGRMQYFMYGAPVDASDNSLPEELNDLASLNEIVDVFASMNHEF